MMTKIAFVTHNLGYGGSQSVMVTLFNHLSRAAFDPYFISFDASGPNLANISTPERVIDLRARRVRYGLPGLVRAVRRLRPEIVFSTLGVVNVPVLMLRHLLPKKTAIVVRESSIPSVSIPGDYSFPKLWGWLYRRWYPRADAVVCQSDYMLNDLALYFGVPRQKLERIYNPVDVARIRELADAGENPYAGPGPQLVAMGRLSWDKRFDFLLDAMATIRKSFPHVRLTILGGGPLEKTLKAQQSYLRLNEAVRFFGFQPNPYPFLRHAHLTLLTSRHEGLPNVVLEALALGTSVAAGDCPGGLREVAACHRGLKLLNGDNPEKFAQGVIQTLREGEMRHGDEDDAGFIERFDVTAVVPRYEELFKLVAERVRATGSGRGA